MAAPSTVLCIRRDPEQLTLLREKGYGLVTAMNGSEGLRLLMSRPADAVVQSFLNTIWDCWTGRWWRTKSGAQDRSFL